MVYVLAESTSGEDIHCQTQCRDTPVKSSCEIFWSTLTRRVVTCEAIKLIVETDLSLHYVADRSLKDQSFLVASPGAIHYSGLVVILATVVRENIRVSPRPGGDSITTRSS